MAVRKRGSEKSVQVEPFRAFSPFESMERWFDEMFRGPSPFLSTTSWPWLHPWNHLDEVRASVDMFDDGENIVFKVEVPGINKEDIELTVTADLLTVSGEKKKEEKVEKKDYYRLERSSGSFTRSFRLPEGVKTDEVKAKFDNGVLSVKIPKTERAKAETKKIKVE